MCSPALVPRLGSPPGLLCSCGFLASLWKSCSLYHSAHRFGICIHVTKQRALIAGPRSSPLRLLSWHLLFHRRAVSLVTPCLPPTSELSSRVTSSGLTNAFTPGNTTSFFLSEQMSLAYHRPNNCLSLFASFSMCLSLTSPQSALKVLRPEAYPRARPLQPPSRSFRPDPTWTAGW